MDTICYHPDYGHKTPIQVLTYCKQCEGDIDCVVEEHKTHINSLCAHMLLDLINKIAQVFGLGHIFGLSMIQ